MTRPWNGHIIRPWNGSFFFLFSGWRRLASHPVALVPMRLLFLVAVLAVLVVLVIFADNGDGVWPTGGGDFRRHHAGTSGGRIARTGTAELFTTISKMKLTRGPPPPPSPALCPLLKGMHASMVNGQTAKPNNKQWRLPPPPPSTRDPWVQQRKVFGRADAFMGMEFLA